MGNEILKKRVKVFLIILFAVWGLRMAHNFKAYIDAILMLLISLSLYREK